MPLKSASSHLSGVVLGVGFSSNKLFYRLNIFSRLQCFEVRGQVAVRDFQQLFHRIEVNLFVHHQHGHNAQPDAAFEDFIKIGYNAHYFTLSYLKCIMLPYRMWQSPKPIVQKIIPLWGSKAANNPKTTSAIPK